MIEIKNIRKYIDAEVYKNLIEKSENIGVTAGASTPEYIITNVINAIKLKGEI